MTTVDGFLILVFLGVCVWALVQRFVRQLMTLAMLFVTTAIAGFAYPYGALALAAVQEEAPTLADGLAFTIIFLFFAIVLEVLLRQGFPVTRLPKLRALDNLLGLLVGLVNGLIIVSLLLSMLAYTVHRSWGEIAPRVRRSIARATHDSVLRPYLTQFMEFYLKAHVFWFRRPPPLLGYLLR